MVRHKRYYPPVWTWSIERGSKHRDYLENPREKGAYLATGGLNGDPAEHYSSGSDSGRENSKRSRHRPSDRSDNSSDDGYDSRRGGMHHRVVATYGGSYSDSRNGGRRSRQKGVKNARRAAEGNQAVSDSASLGSSSEDEKRMKKMKGEQLLTAGLATVATIHAADKVYETYKKHQARKKAVQLGGMTEAEAKKLETKALLEDSVSIGLAALSIKGVVSVSFYPTDPTTKIYLLTPWKKWESMRDMRHEYRKFEGKKGERHKKRMERQRQLQYGGVDIKAMGSGGPAAPGSSAPDLYYGGRYDQQQPYYTGGNPYASIGLPVRPVGHAYESRR